jgi:hypothetical protein
MRPLPGTLADRSRVVPAAKGLNLTEHHFSVNGLIRRVHVALPKLAADRRAYAAFQIRILPGAPTNGSAPQVRSLVSTDDGGIGAAEPVIGDCDDSRPLGGQAQWWGGIARAC